MGRKRETFKVFDGSREELLQHLNGAVIMAIDTENMHRKRKRRIADCQIEISFFDPNDASQRIKTYNFISGSADYCSKVIPRFLFGESKQIENSDIGESIQSVFPSLREVVLVGHSLHAELRMLEICKISLPFKCVVDTERLAKNIMPELSHMPELSYLGSILNIPMTFRHRAGNDAHYALVVLLGLICYNISQEVDVELSRNMFVAFKKTRADVIETKQPTGMPHKKSSREKLEKLKRQEIERNTQKSQRESVRAYRAARKKASYDFDRCLADSDLKALLDG